MKTLRNTENKKIDLEYCVDTDPTAQNLAQSIPQTVKRIFPPRGIDYT